MFGVTLIFTLAILGGLIAFIGDKLGYKLGKQRLSIFGLRPKNTSTLMAVLSGISIAALSLSVLSATSSDVRTALFGMDRLKTQLASMSSEVESKNKELDNLKKQLEHSTVEMQEALLERDKANTYLRELEVAQNKAQEELSRYQKESADLERLRGILQSEITNLQEETRTLEQGLINLREGQVAFRAGQVIYSGVLRAGQNQDETLKMIGDFLTFANSHVINILGLEDKETQVIIVTQANFINTVNYFLQNKGPMAVRLQAAGNILAGEPVVTELRAQPNKLLYQSGKAIYSEDIPADIDKRAAQAILINFLSKLNSRVVAEGLLPDPLTGNVGNLELPYMMEVMEKIRLTQGAFKMTAIANGNIYTLGPLQVEIVISERR